MAVVSESNATIRPFSCANKDNACNNTNIIQNNICATLLFMALRINITPYIPKIYAKKKKKKKPAKLFTLILPLKVRHKHFFAFYQTYV